MGELAAQSKQPWRLMASPMANVDETSPWDALERESCDTAISASYLPTTTSAETAYDARCPQLTRHLQCELAFLQSALRGSLLSVPSCRIGNNNVGGFCVVVQDHAPAHS